MSENQYLAFRAIDGPVSEKNLAFMRRQSSRAEITAWAFDNEYHYGDFGGDEVEMLRRGYDFHYANFGIRKLMIRLPHGLPDAKADAPYFEEDSLSFLKDKQGPVDHPRSSCTCRLVRQKADCNGRFRRCNRNSALFLYEKIR